MRERLLRVQVVSGLVFAAFLFFHLVNQAIAMAGPAAYDGTQAALRSAYQLPLLEVLVVLAPLLVHVGAAVTRWVKFREPTPASWPARLHRYSGRFLALVVFGHIVATRAPSFTKGLFPGFDGVAFTFQWMPAYFWPYYLALALCGWFHLVYGLKVAGAVLKLSPLSWLSRGRALVVTALVGAALLVGGVLRFGLEPRDLSDGPYARYVKAIAADLLGDRAPK